MSKILLLVLDGLGDRPNDSLRGQTCLEAAETPFLDRMAREGSCGLVRPFQTGLFPTSEDTHFSLFGYDVERYRIGRGVFEALGLGVKLDAKSVAWRGNWATLDNSGSIVDRRAGRIPASEELIADIENLNIEGIDFRLYLGKEHRLVLVMKGEGLSNKVSDGYRRQLGVPPPLVTPLDKSKEAAFTASLVNRYLNQVHSLLKGNAVNRQREERGQPSANYILLRGAGRLTEVPTFQDKWNWEGACVAGGHLYRGVSSLIGLEVVDVPGASAGTDTDLSGKIGTALKLLEKKDFVFCHIKAVDTLSHERNCLGKVDFLEKIDRHLRPIFEAQNITVVVTGDHSTPCELGEHSEDSIPLLVWGDGVPKDGSERFGESFCAKGSLGPWGQTRVLEKVSEMVK